MKVLLDVGISPRLPSATNPFSLDGVAMSSPLHLPDLTIKGFRGIDHLTIPRLGRVTLLAGQNGVGKTTVLEAVRVFAARGRFSALVTLLQDRQEIDSDADENSHRVTEIDTTSLFFGRSSSKNQSISIGPNKERLRIDIIPLEEEVPTLLSVVDPVQGLSVRFRDTRQIRWNFSEKNLMLFQQHQPFPPNDKPEPEIKIEELGPQLSSESDIARIWDSVALTNDEDRAMQALKLVLDYNIIGVAVVGDGDPTMSKRRTLVRIKEQDRPVPLKSLGDGAVRLFGVALALANSRGGFLLIDEAENGIHHSVQYVFWKMVLQTAQENAVQVLATTHSWDCVRGFAYAAAEIGEAEGILVRLDRDDRGLRPVNYSEEDLKVAADQGIEVR